MLTRFIRDEEGQDLIEYGLLLGIIVVAVITSVNSIGTKVAGYFADLDASLP